MKLYLAALIFALGVLSAGCFGSRPAPAPEQQTVVAALADAVQLLEVGRFGDFWERYASNKNREMFRQFNLTARRYGEEMAEQPESAEKLKTYLKRKLACEPVLNPEKTVAIFPAEGQERSPLVFVKVGGAWRLGD
jgi:hypothetical protein